METAKGKKGQIVDRQPVFNFPDSFQFGSGVSSIQIEGRRNIQGLTDWDGLKSNFPPELPLRADWGDLKQARADVRMLSRLGLNSQRVSLAWERICPDKGKVDLRALGYYRRLINTIEAAGLAPLVTLNHNALPARIAARGGWHSPGNLKEFEFFCRVAATEFSDVKDWLSLNEPNVAVAEGYVTGNRPPGKRNLALGLLAAVDLALAHEIAYTTLKAAIPDAKVGLAQFIALLKPYNPQSFLDRLLTELANRTFNLSHLYAARGHLDFVGANYYTGFFLKAGLPDNAKRSGRQLPAPFPGSKLVLPSTLRSDTGWPVVPDFLHELLTRLQRQFNIPIMVTENGVADQGGDLRSAYVLGSLANIAQAMAEGADVKGYYYWSSVDSWEPDGGLKTKYGLLQVDLQTGRRFVSAGARLYGQVARTGRLDVAALSKQHLTPAQQSQLWGMSLPERQQIKSVNRAARPWPPKHLRDFDSHPAHLPSWIFRTTMGVALGELLGSKMVTNWMDWNKRPFVPLLLGTKLEGDPTAFALSDRRLGRRIGLIRMNLGDWKNGYLLEPTDEETDWHFAFHIDGRRYTELCLLRLSGPVVALAGPRPFTAYAIDASSGREIALKRPTGLVSRYDKSIPWPRI